MVEDNVSIGSGATILPVTLPAGCVIGAGSVVTEDLKLKGIYVGKPSQADQTVIDLSTVSSKENISRLIDSIPSKPHDQRIFAEVLLFW